MITPFVNGLRLVCCINMRILCVSVCLSVISEISGTGHHNATLLIPLWKASAGELHRLLLELTRCLVQEEKPLQPFHKRNNMLQIRANCVMT